MRRLFKYTKKEYLLNLLKNGELRLGTLYEYRNYENQEIRDLEEGTGFSLNYIKDETFTNHGKNDLTLGLLKLIDCEDVRIINVSSRQSFDLPNSYIYSLTMNPDKVVMTHFGYDACFEIMDLKGFTTEIATELNNKGLLKMFGGITNECFYKNRHVNPTDKKELAMLAWTKDVRFAHQQEYRLLFESKINTELP